MRVPDETLDGYNFEEDGKYIRMEYWAPMTCFTELRPTQSVQHTKRYGLLGVVVDRRFVLDRQGQPVQYVRSNSNDDLVGGVISTGRWIREQAEKLLEIAKASEAPSDKEEADKARAIDEYFSYQCAFLKRMSKEYDPLGVLMAPQKGEDFIYYEEHEWRIVYNRYSELMNKIVSTGKDKPKYRIPLEPSDIEMLVVPDREMRNQILQDDRGKEIREWFAGDLPAMITVEQLQHL